MYDTGQIDYDGDQGSGFGGMGGGIDPTEMFKMFFGGGGGMGGMGDGVLQTTRCMQSLQFTSEERL